MNWKSSLVSVTIAATATSACTIAMPVVAGVQAHSYNKKHEQAALANPKTPRRHVSVPLYVVGTAALGLLLDAVQIGGAILALDEQVSFAPFSGSGEGSR